MLRLLEIHNRAIQHAVAEHHGTVIKIMGDAFLVDFPSVVPAVQCAHLNLAAVYSELGREAEARAEAAEVLRINPQFSLEVHKQRAPIKDPAQLERHLAGLRKAGLK